MDTKEIFKRNLFNKFEYAIKQIKLNINKDNTPEEKKRLQKKIALVIFFFQMDALYEKLTDVSGMVALLNLFGISETNAEKLKKIGYGGCNVATLSILIYKFLYENPNEQDKLKHVENTKSKDI